MIFTTRQHPANINKARIKQNSSNEITAKKIINLPLPSTLLTVQNDSRVISQMLHLLFNACS